MLRLRIHKRDFLLIPVWVTLLRFPLAAVFPFTLSSPALALLVLALAAFTDVLDGYLARHLNQESDLGAIADGIADKFFVIVVAFSVWWYGLFSLTEVFLINARDIGEGLVLIRASITKTPLARQTSRANSLGKLTTILQFIAIVLAILGSRLSLPCSVITAVVGLIAVWIYERRVIEEASH